MCTNYWYSEFLGHTCNVKNIVYKVVCSWPRPPCAYLHVAQAYSVGLRTSFFI